MPDPSIFAVGQFCWNCCGSKLWDCISEEFSYGWHYDSNFENLKTEVGKLTDERERIQNRVDAERRRGMAIHNIVEEWLGEANKTIDEAGKLIEEEKANIHCCLCMCLRYQLGKHAALNMNAINRRRGEVGGLDPISYHTVPKNIRLASMGNYETFESRMSVLTDILNALESPDHNMIGIYGMGGIGKTMLVREVGRHAERRELFDKVVIVEVSQSPDIRWIQGEIADQLGLKLEEESLSGRASKLFEKLKEEEKILVILDDIWEKLDLVDVGIAHGDFHKGCKILLAGRDEIVLSRKMKSQRNFLLGFLSEEEAWNLMKKMAGDNIEGGDFKSIATEVANACARLPIAISTVAMALRNAELFEWQNALQRLRAPSSMNLKEILPEAYSAIKFSYDKLEDKELQKIFSLIAYTYITSIDDLLMYGMGLGLIQGIDTMEEAQARVRTLVHKLKASCMLIANDTNISDEFSMHDVVRAVAICISSRDHPVFTTRILNPDQLTWPDKDKLNLCCSIVLDNVNFNELPEIPECPQLKLFYAYFIDWPLEIPEHFFDRMKELRVLELREVGLQSLPSSLGNLTDLRTLCLTDCRYFCKREQTAFIGGLKKLEILCFRGTDIYELPMEIGRLIRLRSLDLRDCFNLKVIPPTVISSLANLEELYIGSFDGWEVIEGSNNNERNNTSLDELKCLSKLNCLEISIKDAKTLPGDLILENLKRYKISIGHCSDRITPPPPEISKKFELGLINTNICLNKGHIMQLQGIQDLFMEGLHDMNNVLYGLDTEGFPQLKHLKIWNNPNLMCVIDSVERKTRNAFPNLESLSLENLINLEKICQGQITVESFTKLKIIKVKGCDRLRNIFPFFIVRLLQQLESIEVSMCGNMEKVFDIGRGDESNSNNELIDHNIELNQLRLLTLESLPQLTNFCSTAAILPTSNDAQTNEIVMEDNTDVSNTFRCEQKVVVKLPLDGQKSRSKALKIAASISGVESVTLNTSKILVMGDGMDVVMLVALLRKKVGHAELVSIGPAREEKPKGSEVKTLSTSRHHINAEEHVSETLFNQKIAFPRLEKISIFNMDNVKIIWHHQLAEDSFCNLTSLAVFSCHKLRILFPRNIYRKFLRLKLLTVYDCRSLEVIFDFEGPNFEETDSVETQLHELSISSLPNLKHVWNRDPQSRLNFQKLGIITIVNCDVLKNVFPASIARNLSQLESLCIGGRGVEEIVFVPEVLAVEANTRLVFGRVTYLRLSDLPELRTFFPRRHATEWPVLKKLEVEGSCDIVKIFTQPKPLAEQPHFWGEKIFPFYFCWGEKKPSMAYHGQEGLTNNMELNESNIENDINITNTFLNQVFPKLEELIVRGKGISIIEQLPEELLCKLKYLLVNFDESIDILSLDFLKRFQNMKELILRGDQNFEQDLMEAIGMLVVICDLNKCTELKNISIQESNMDNLIHLEVSSCDKLINLVPSSTSFQNLTILEVQNCNEMINIVAASTAKSLVRLRQMRISGGNKITEIVASEEGNAEKDEIVFSGLKELSLKCLTSLTSFCSGNHKFSFPSLEELVMEECPNMNTFCGGELSTPMLLRVKQDKREYEVSWNGNLNSTIQHLYKMEQAAEDEQELEEEEESDGEQESENEEESDGEQVYEVQDEEEDVEDSDKKIPGSKGDSGQPSTQHLE